MSFLKVMEANEIQANEVTYNSIASSCIEEVDLLKTFPTIAQYLNRPKLISDSMYDFHGLMLGSALYWCKENIIDKTLGSELTLIVGKGNHSKEQAVLKPGIKNYLTRHGFSVEEDVNNIGRFVVSVMK